MNGVSYENGVGRGLVTMVVMVHGGKMVVLTEAARNALLARIDSILRTVVVHLYERTFGHILLSFPFVCDEK